MNPRKGKTFKSYLVKCIGTKGRTNTNLSQKHHLIQNLKKQISAPTHQKSRKKTKPTHDFDLLMLLFFIINKKQISVFPNSTESPFSQSQLNSVIIFKSNNKTKREFDNLYTYANLELRITQSNNASGSPTSRSANFGIRTFWTATAHLGFFKILQNQASSSKLQLRVCTRIEVLFLMKNCSEGVEHDDWQPRDDFFTQRLSVSHLTPIFFFSLILF